MAGRNWLAVSFPVGCVDLRLETAKSSRDGNVDDYDVEEYRTRPHLVAGACH